MPEEGSILVPFLNDALKTGKYRNLIYEDSIKKVFCLYLPRKTDKLDIKDQLIFKDWRNLFDKEYKFLEDYSIAKQNMTQSLRRSDYVELMDNSNNKLTCRILSGKEVKEIKKQKNEKKRKRTKEEHKENNTSYKIAKKKLKIQSMEILLKRDDQESVASDESGYETTLNSPESCMGSGQNNKELLESIDHDHAYISSLSSKEYRGESNVCNDQNVSNKAVGNDIISGVFDRFLTLDPENSSELQSIVGDDYLNDDFFDVPPISDDLEDSIEGLFKISNDQLIGGSFKELQSSQQGNIIFEEAVWKRIQRYNFVENLIYDDVYHLDFSLKW